MYHPRPPSASLFSFLLIFLSIVTLAEVLDHTFIYNNENEPARSLDRRNDSTPAPIQFPANQYWDGIDGQWSSFTIRAGTPPQFVRVFISMTSQQTWVIDPRNCDNALAFDTKDACLNDRGLAFDPTASTSWSEIGQYSLSVENNLGYNGNATNGYDTVSLGTEGTPIVTIENSTVGAIKSQDYWLGAFGLHPKPTNFKSFENPSPSYMTYLKEQGHIPSLSLGYTAGNQYTYTKVLGSLTIGGYDASKFIPNNVSFPFAPDNSRDLVVSIQNITMESSKKESMPLSKDPFQAFIDSTVSQLWLPPDACALFEQAFGLTYDDATNLYLVNDILHDQLLDIDANVTFTLGIGLTGGATVDITLPYDAFDLIAEPPYQGLTNNTRYFPLRRANDTMSYTLGRTFLQEAYVVVDFERSNFSVSQCNWELGLQPDVIPINPSSLDDSPYSSDPTTDANGNGDESSQKQGEGPGTSVIIAIAISVAIAVSVTLAVGWFFWRRKNKKMKKLIEEANAVAGKRSSEQSSKSSINAEAGSKNTTVIPKAELPGDTVKSASTIGLLSGDGAETPPCTPLSPVETEGEINQIYEMPGSIPERNEADSRQYSEKEALVFRERRYNGIDPSPSTPSTPNFAALNFSRRIPLGPGDVVPLVGTSQPLTLSSSASTPISPMVTMQTLGPQPSHRRFSYEEPTDDEKTR